MSAECCISCVADTATVSVSLSEKCASPELLSLLFYVTFIDFEEVVLNCCFDTANYLSNRRCCVLMVFNGCCVMCLSFMLHVMRSCISELSEEHIPLRSYLVTFSSVIK